MRNNWLLRLRRLLPDRAAQDSQQLERLAELQREAKLRRAEYDAEIQRAASGGNTPDADLLAAKKDRMKRAEAAHLAALQEWENRASRQQSQ